MERKKANDLEAAFKQDHRLLGAGFHELSQRLRAQELARARAAAQRLDREAGAHIAFEEEHFYPKLRALLGETAVRRLYDEHAVGRSIVEHLCSLPDEGQLDADEWRHLLAGAEAMEDHIAECGALFDALKNIPDQERRALHQQLLEWRRRNPSWRRYADKGRAGGTQPVHRDGI